jgi:hypothetical protein
MISFLEFIEQDEIVKQALNEGIYELLSEESSQPPTKTITAYKLFKKKGKNIYPLYVHADKPIEIGKWIDAEMGELTANGKVKSKLGELAFRPGWHSGNIPIAHHIGGKSHKNPKLPPDYRPDDQVWAEVELPADVDWDTEAQKRASKSKTGKIIARTAHITDQLPKGGHYSYKTNSNMVGSWLISGSMKVNRILSDREVEKINKLHNTADLPRLKK